MSIFVKVENIEGPGWAWIESRYYGSELVPDCSNSIVLPENVLAFVAAQSGRYTFGSASFTYREIAHGPFQ